MPNEEPKGRFAAALQKRMDEMGLDMREVAKATEATYEHIRKLTRAISYPSPYYLRVLCDVLDWKYADAEQLALMDRIESYPEWTKLSMVHKQELIEEARKSSKNARK